MLLGTILQIGGAIIMIVSVIGLSITLYNNHKSNKHPERR